MKARQFFENVLCLYQVYKAKKNKCDELCYDFGLKGISYDKLNVQSSIVGSQVENIALKLESSFEDADIARREYFKAVDKAKPYIDKLTKTVYKEIVVLHYIYGMDFVQIADRLEKPGGDLYSYQHIYNSHSKAMKELEKMFSKSKTYYK